MAENITRALPAPHLEEAGKALLTAAKPIGMTQLDATQLGAPTQAGLDPFRKQAEALAASQLGLGALTRDATSGAVTGIAGTPGVAGYEQYLTGAGGISAPTYTAQQLAGPMTAAQLSTTAGQGYMSPYASAVKDTTLAEFDAQKARDQQNLQLKALQAGAFGGGRHGLAESDFLTQSGLDRAALTAGLDQAAYKDAVGLRDADRNYLMDLAQQTQQQGLGSLTTLGALGQSGQLFGQTGEDIASQRQAMTYKEPYERLGWWGNLVAQQMGGYPQAPYYSSAGIGTQQSPFMEALTAGAGLGNILGKIWGQRSS